MRCVCGYRLPAGAVSCCPDCGTIWWWVERLGLGTVIPDPVPSPAHIAADDPLPRIDAMLHGMDLAIAELRRLVG